MKKFLVAMAVMMVASIVMAKGEKAEAKTTDLQGKLAVTKTEAGVLQGIKLMVGDKSYTVKLNEQAKKMADITADKTVKVTCVVDEKTSTITVSKFAVVEAEGAGAKAEADPKPEVPEAAE